MHYRAFVILTVLLLTTAHTGFACEISDFTERCLNQIKVELKKAEPNRTWFEGFTHFEFGLIVVGTYLLGTMTGVLLCTFARRNKQVCQDNVYVDSSDNIQRDFEQQLPNNTAELNRHSTPVDV